MPKLSQSRKIFELVLLILAAGSIYPLVYLRQTFETTILELYKISPEELAGLYTMLGLFFVLGYIPSGLLADIFSVKSLILVSLTITGLTGIVYAQIPDSSFLGWMYVAWGVSTVLTFWSALLKSVHLLAGENQEGRFFGALDGGRGLVEAILATAAIALFAAVAGGGDLTFEESKAGFQAVVYMYVAIVFLVAVGLFFFMPNRREQELEARRASRAANGSAIAEVLKIVKIPEIWVMMLIIFCGYTLFWAHYYFSGYLVANHGATAVSAGVVTVIVLWMRPLGGFSGGFLADKFGRARILSLAMVATAIMLIVMAVVPMGAPIMVIYGLVVVAGLVMYVIRGVYWSLLDECRVSPTVVGIAIGIVSFFGYLPDIIIPSVSGAIYNSFGDDTAGANNVFFMVCAAIGLLGAAAAYYFHTLVKKRAAFESKQEQLETEVSA